MTHAGTSASPHVHVAIVGSGFGGLGTAIRLKQSGEHDFVILERADDVGGTWRDNSYPGCACDVQSHLYSFSFALNPRWSRSYSPQSEIWQYLKECARRYGVLPHVRYGHDVRAATWDEETRRWFIETSKGRFSADVLVAASGALSDAALPNLKGLSSFEGEAFHSAKWNHDYDLRGKNVAVIGTGASAIQFVPAIQPKVGKLRLFQRTPPWILPRRDRAIGGVARSIYENVPFAQRLTRAGIYAGRELFALGFMKPWVMSGVEKIARRHLAKSIRDPELRQKLVPNYTIGCKRILLSDDYYPAIAKDNVDVVTSGIREVDGQGLVTEDGRHHAADAIVFGTGFQVTDPPISKHVRGRDGRTLAEVWAGSPKAHLGVTVAGFPNFFLLLGPNTGLGHTSVVFMIESQLALVMDTLRHLSERGAQTFEPKQSAQDAYVADVDGKLRASVWNSGGCASWYIDHTGRNSTLWPGFTFDYAKRVAKFDPSEFVLGYGRAVRRETRDVRERAAGAEGVDSAYGSRPSLEPSFQQPFDSEDASRSATNGAELMKAGVVDG